MQNYPATPHKKGMSHQNSTHPAPNRLAMRAGGTRLPQPIPYQGSKRLLAPTILGVVTGRKFRRLYEPFAGSGAVTLAAAKFGLAEHFVLGDSLAPLIGIWDEMLQRPQ